ncbi:MAG: COG1361 S-layer family protein [Nanoarchaeota archaeon]|nr:COG1361 S-layer family protein [Nanoarchaeota archaeon]
MKKWVVLLSLILISLAYSVQAADYQAAPNIQVTLLSHEPDPVKPGEVVEVRFKVENSGQQTTNDIIFELQPKFPFSLYSGELTRNLGQMKAKQTGADASIISYKLKVDETAVEGDNEIEARVKIAQAVWKSYVNDELLIKIQSPDAVLAMEGIYTKPSQLVPGQDGQLLIKLQNNADNVLRNIKFKLDLSDDELPIVPIDSSSEKNVYQITAGDSEWVVFDLVAEPDAESKIYKVPIELTYYDLAGTKYTNDGYIGIRIGDEPELLVYISETEVYSQGQKGAITITLANRGLANIKLLKMTLMENDNYEIISPNEIYLGDVDSDDIESQDFEVYIIDGKGTINLPVKLEYRDANNKKIQETYQVPLKLYSSWQAKKFGLKKSNTITVIVILIILGIVGYFLYRKYWHKKKKKQ